MKIKKPGSKTVNKKVVKKKIKVNNKANTTIKEGTRTDDAHTPANRPERKAFSLGTSLTIPSWVTEKYGRNGERYFFYFFIDKNIEQAIAAYYEFVEDEQGNKVKHPAKDGDAKMTLMVLPMKYRLEDVRLKREKNRAIMAEGAPLKNLDGSQEYKPKE